MSNRVLIVDDSRATRLQLRKFLLELGYEVVGEAENGIEAIDQFARLKPDLMTLDLIMPELDGAGALSEIRRFSKKGDVLLISSIEKGPLINQLRDLGVRHFLMKPVTLPRLRQALAEMKKEKAA